MNEPNIIDQHDRLHYVSYSQNNKIRHLTFILDSICG